MMIEGSVCLSKASLGRKPSVTRDFPGKRFTPRDSRGKPQQSELYVARIGGTEREFVTVLFVDVKGSMDLIGAIELEEWWSLIDGLFELMCESVYRFGGWVASFTGDGIKAVFDAPGAADDHGQRACEAALWLRDAMCAPAADLQSEHGLELSVRIGINSGEVLTGTIGDRYRRCYTANGYPVALAKRMEALALPGRIYLSEHTAALVTGAVQLRDLGAFEVKGAPRPVGVFELLGRGSRLERAHAAGHRAFGGTPGLGETSGRLQARTHRGRVGHDPPRRISANDDEHDRSLKSTASHTSISRHSGW